MHPHVVWKIPSHMHYKMLGIHLGNPRLHGNRIGPVLLSSVSSLPGVLNTYSAELMDE